MTKLFIGIAIVAVIGYGLLHFGVISFGKPPISVTSSEIVASPRSFDEWLAAWGFKPDGNPLTLRRVCNTGMEAPMRNPLKGFVYIAGPGGRTGVVSRGEAIKTLAESKGWKTCFDDGFEMTFVKDGKYMAVFLSSVENAFAEVAYEY
jgi:hypothetical protein